MKKLLVIIVAISIVLLTTFSVSGLVDVSSEYAEEFYKYAGITKECEDVGYYSGPLYSYYSIDGSEYPDWVFVSGSNGIFLDAFIYGVFGDYCIRQPHRTYPSSLGYYIYFVEENKFYPIEVAWELEFQGKEKIFTDYLIPNGIAETIGDNDSDGKLSIIDATKIQMALVGASDFHPYDELNMYQNISGRQIKYISDFDRDGERTVLDATAIQHKLAGLEY